MFDVRFASTFKQRLIIIIIYYLIYLTVPAIAVAGFRLRNAFNHFVFIDELDVDSFRSPRGGDPRSAFPKKSSFCECTKRNTFCNLFLVRGIQLI